MNAPVLGMKVGVDVTVTARVGCIALSRLRTHLARKSRLVSLDAKQNARPARLQTRWAECRLTRETSSGKPMRRQTR